jgi:Ca2+-binding RTX toxin-like protein
MRGTRYLIPALLVGSGILAACASDDPSQSQGATAEESDDWGDPGLYPELGGKYAQELTAFSGTCGWDSTNATVTLTSSTSQTAIIGVRAADGVFLVNGALCNGTKIVGKSIKNVVFKSSAGANETLIVDYIGGLFAPSTSTKVGIDVQFAATGTKAVKVRGTSAADNFAFGTGSSGPGLQTAKDAYPDLVVSTNGASASYSFSLAGGNDLFTTVADSSRGITTAWGTNLVVFGGEGNDSLVGGTGSDTLRGGAGSDTIIGGLGGDSLYGDQGNDYISMTSATDGADYVDCGTDGGTGVEIDYAYYAQRTHGLSLSLDNTANDGFTGEGDNVQSTCEVLYAGSGNDTLLGVDNSALTYFGHMIMGGAGDDSINAQGGVDTVNGGAGNDTFFEGTVGNGSDVFVGGDGTDLLDYSSRSAPLTVSMNGTAADDGLASEGDNVKADVEDIIGGSGNDVITGNDGDNRIIGGLGNDSLIGGKGNDTFHEGTVTSGSDAFVGGDGFDVLDYSSRSAAITVSMGQWSNVGGTTVDVGGNDGLSGEGDTCGSDIESAIGGSATDLILGNALDNTLEGGSSADTIYGFEGSDIIDPGGQADSIDCGGGDDILMNSSGSTTSNCEL